MASMAHSGFSNVLKNGGFQAFLWTQFLGAFNDNLFKNALVILIAYRSLSVLGLSAGDRSILGVAWRRGARADHQTGSRGLLGFNAERRCRRS